MRARQSLTLRTITDAPWCVRNERIRSDLGMETLDDFILRLSQNMFARADASTYPHLREIAPMRAPPESRRPFPRDLLSPPPPEVYTTPSYPPELLCAMSAPQTAPSAPPSSHALHALPNVPVHNAPSLLSFLHALIVHSITPTPPPQVPLSKATPARPAAPPPTPTPIQIPSVGTQVPSPLPHLYSHAQLAPPSPPSRVASPQYPSVPGHVSTHGRARKRKRAFTPPQIPARVDGRRYIPAAGGFPPRTAFPTRPPHGGRVCEDPDAADRSCDTATSVACLCVPAYMQTELCSCLPLFPCVYYASFVSVKSIVSRPTEEFARAR
ncbi:extensin-like [Colias croceus]|uniref:extensin-like n=1 Tax=Colias crocea TaxID=72248 RepID=UPI001E2808A1|nr:extensin-like [Colias croceus]